MKIKLFFKNIIYLFLILVVVLGFIADCAPKKSEDNNNLLLLLFLNSKRKNDGCNFKTNFAVCVPPGIAGN